MYKAALILLLMIAVLPGPVWAVPSPVTGTTQVSVFVPPVVQLVMPTNFCVWDLNPPGPGTYTKTTTVKLRANDRWQLMVAPESPGHMGEWTGGGYTGRNLSAPIKVMSALLSTTVVIPEDAPLEAGTATGEMGREVTIRCVQNISAEDEPLLEGHVYRIVTTFVGTPIQ